MKPLLTAAFILAAWGFASPIHAEEKPFRPVKHVDMRHSGNGLPDSITQRIDDFFGTLNTSTVEQAYFLLFQGTKFADQKEVSNQFVEVTQNSLNAFGKIKRYDVWQKQRYGDRLFLVNMIVQHEKKLLRWDLLFYAPTGDEWTLANLRVDDLRNFMPAVPSSSPPPQAIQLQVEKFFITIQSGKTAEAYEGLLTGTTLMPQEETKKLFVEKTDAALQEYGKMTSYELYDNRPLNADTHLLTYFSSLENEPLRWQFFYRTQADGSWMLENLRVDDLLDEDLVTR